MGIDCKITLPAAARLQDVASVIGRILGCEVHRASLGSSGWHAEVEGVSVASAHCPECAYILIRGAPSGDYRFLYHFEFDRRGNRGIILRSTPYTIAIAKSLVDFFGGSVDFRDHDDIEVDYQQPERDDIHAEDGDEWNSLQERIAAAQRAA